MCQTILMRADGELIRFGNGKIYVGSVKGISKRILSRIMIILHVTISFLVTKVQSNKLIRVLNAMTHLQIIEIRVVRLIFINRKFIR